MSATDQAVRNMRAVHGVMLFSIFLYLFVLSQTRPPGDVLPPVIFGYFGLVALGLLMAAAYIRKVRVVPAAEVLQSKPDESGAIARWRSGLVLTFVLTESVALIGFVAKFMGASWNVAGCFFAVAIFLMILWKPRLELPGQ